MPLLEGQCEGGGTAALPLKSDGTAVKCEIENVTLTVDTTGLATSAKQTDGSQKTQVVDGSGNVAPAGDTVGRASFVKVTDGTNTQPTGDAAARPIFVELSDGASAVSVATAANQATANTSLAAISTAQTDGTQKVKTSLPTSTHVGTNANPNGSSVQFGSQATTIGIAIFAALSTNTADVYIARGSGVTTSTGVPIAPGQSVTLPCANINEYYVISAASQNIRALAL